MFILKKLKKGLIGMLIQATAKLREELNLKELEQKERLALFSWHANFLRINRRKTVVLVNDASDYTVILYGMKKDDFNHFHERVKEGVRRTFEGEGIKESLIEKYLSQFEDFFYQKAENRSYIARMNNSCKIAKRFADRFNENKIYQSQVVKNINNMPRKNDNKDYFYPNESLQQELAEFFVYSEGKDDTKNWNHDEYNRDGYKAILNLTVDQDNLEYNKYELNYQAEDFELAIENEVKLKDILPARIKYIYDYGDNWQHYIETEEIIDDYKSNKPTLLEGDGTAPPEDVGGVGGFDEFMRIISNPDHEEYDSI